MTPTPLKPALLGLLLLYSTTSAAEYVTDKLVAGLYEKPNTQSALVRALSSGTPLEVFQRQGEFRRVRTGDGLEGWLERDYITTEKPARIMLLELQAATGDLKKRLRQSELDLDTLRQQLKIAKEQPEKLPPQAAGTTDAPAIQNVISKYLLTALLFFFLGFFVHSRLKRTDFPGRT